MNNAPRRPALFVLAAASAIALAGCATSAPAAEGVHVVTSTDVYGQIVTAIGGDAVTVTAIIDRAGQDPHSFEASASDQLAVSRADLLIENGGGYDPFMHQLIEATGTEAPVLTAVADEGEDAHDEDSHDEAEHDEDHDEEGHSDHDHDHDHEHGVNEHVWYDPAVMDVLATDIAHELSELDPDNAAAFEANLAAFQEGIAGLTASLTTLDEAHGGASIFVTEPVALHLTDAAGLENVTPDAFSEAVEEGQDVPPATLLEAIGLVPEVDVVIVNAQTGGAETDRIVEEAQAHDVPVVEFTETLPADSTYLEWMADNIAALESALS